MPTTEDILADPDACPFNKEIDNALSPFLDQLKALLLNPDNTDKFVVPAKRHLIENHKRLTELVPYVGDISIMDRARVTNWFHRLVANSEDVQPHTWIGLLPLAHAFTLLLVSRLRIRITGYPDFPSNGSAQVQENFILDKCWEHQVQGDSNNAWMEVDVDKECLERLEERMFERSARAGPAGHFQWGLDAGVHQENWDPYGDLPDEWNHGDWEGSETELKVR